MHPILGDIEVPADIEAAAKNYPQLDPEDPVQRAAMEKLIKREMERNRVEHDERVLAELVKEKAARKRLGLTPPGPGEERTIERLAGTDPNAVVAHALSQGSELASGYELDVVAHQRGLARALDETDARLRERLAIVDGAEREASLAERIRAGGGAVEGESFQVGLQCPACTHQWSQALPNRVGAVRVKCPSCDYLPSTGQVFDDPAKPGMVMGAEAGEQDLVEAAVEKYYAKALETNPEQEESIVDEDKAAEDEYEDENEAEGLFDILKGQLSDIGEGVALGGKLVATNQAGELMLRIASRIAAKAPESFIARMLEDEDGREAAKLATAFLIHSIGTYAPLPKGKEALRAIAKLQFAASTFILGNKYGGLIMGEIEELIGLGEKVMEMDRVAALPSETMPTLSEVVADGVREKAASKAG